MSLNFKKNEIPNFVDDKDYDAGDKKKIIKQKGYDSSLIRLESFESEEDFNKHSKRNDKKSLFMKYGPIDGQIIYTYGIDAKIEKKGVNKDRTFTIYKEQKHFEFLKSQDVQRRKSAEGSQFGFLNKRIIALDNLAPFHPNYQPALKLTQDKFLPFAQDQSPSRRLNASQKTRIFQQRESIEMYGENRIQKRQSIIQKQAMLSSIVNNTTGTVNANNNNKMDYIVNSDMKGTDKLPNIGNMQKRNSRSGTVLKKLQSNVGSPQNQTNNQFHTFQMSFLALEKSPSKSTSNQQQSLIEDSQEQNTIKQDLSSYKIEERNRNTLNERKKQQNEQQSNQKSITQKSRRTHTHQDLSDFQTNIAASSQKPNQIPSVKALKTQSKDDNSHSSPMNMAVFFSLHKNSSKQIIQKYINQNGVSTTTTLGSTSFQEKIQQEKPLQANESAKKNDLNQGLGFNTFYKKEKLQPLTVTDKKQQKSSQQLFSSVYISQNPLYKKKMNQSKRLTLPDIPMQKTFTINNNQPIKTITQIDQKDREPLTQKSVGSTTNIQFSNNNQQQKVDVTKKVAKKVDYKLENLNQTKKTENSETKLNFRKQSLNQIKQQESLNIQQQKKLSAMQQFIK